MSRGLILFRLPCCPLWNLAWQERLLSRVWLVSSQRSIQAARWAVLVGCRWFRQAQKLRQSTEAEVGSGTTFASTKSSGAAHRLATACFSTFRAALKDRLSSKPHHSMTRTQQS